MSDRREFIKQMSCIGIGGSLAGSGGFAPEKPDSKIWGCLVHLSYNMWVEYSTPGPFKGYRPYLQVDETLWDDVLDTMAREGMNLVLIDIGDGIRYKSHPEIAVNRAWEPEKLREQLAKIRGLGIEPVPKLNFAAGHDVWLGEYSRMVSTKKYYEVCRDLIYEVIDIFDTPRFFHLGMDEENADDQRFLDYVVVRQNDLWWHDFYYLVDLVERKGSRAWIWSDYLWHFPELFFKKMPKSVLQSNWYYEKEFDIAKTPVKAYLDLEKYGYDQIPTGSFHAGNDYNIMNTVKFCTENITTPRLYGFLQSYWAPTTEVYRNQILQAIRLIGDAKRSVGQMNR